jgi:ABC-type phosphate transport system ATPase subunit
VTHNPDQAKRIADRVVLLVNGRLEDEGAPDHLFREDSEHLAAVFAAGELE